MNLILLRHGESQWNLENRFAGWEDVDLTSSGINEAKFAAYKILEKNFQIDSIYTSVLKRAKQTTDIVCNLINFDINKIKYEWRLNERHYGALQGLNKSETAAKFGENQVKIWRRSFNVPPPMLNNNDKRHPRFNDIFKFIEPKNLPSGESLKMVIERIKPFWNNYFSLLNNNQSHLIVAHSNSLRAIIKILDNLSDSEIIEVNIPTGVPLVYTFDMNKKVIKKEFLMNSSQLQKKLDIVANQGKIT